MHPGLILPLFRVYSREKFNMKNKSFASVKTSTTIAIGDVIELENHPGPIFEFYLKCGCNSSQKFDEKLNFLHPAKATVSLAMNRLFFF